MSHRLSYQPECDIARRRLIIPSYHPMVIASTTSPTRSFDSPCESGFPCCSHSYVFSFHFIASPCMITSHIPKVVRKNHLPVIPLSSPCVNYPTFYNPNHHQICPIVIQRLSLNRGHPFKFLPDNPSDQISVAHSFHLMAIFCY